MKFKSPKLLYYTKLAITNIFRNSVMSMSSIMVLTACLVIVGSFSILIKNFDNNISKLDNYNIIMAFVQSDATEGEVGVIKEQFDANGFIYEFIPKSEALEEAAAKYGDNEAFLWESFKEDNPLKDSFAISYSSVDEMENIEYKLSGIENIEKYKDWADVAGKIDKMKSILSGALFWLMMLLFVVSLFVIVNTIKLTIFARRNEIAIMGYVGASNFYIRLPFLIEGAILGILSAVIGFFLQFIVYKYLVLGVVGNSNLVSILPFSEFQGFLLLVFSAIGLFAGVFSSFISLLLYRKDS